MKSFLSSSVCMLAIILGASMAHAANTTMDSQKHFYVLGGAGMGILKDAKINDDGNVEDGNDLALRAGLGYQFNRYFGVESDFIYFSPVDSDFRGTKYEASAQSLAILAVAKFPIEQFAVFAKVGPSYNWKEVKADRNYVDDTYTEEEWEAAFGGGVEYNFTNTWGTQVEYLATGEDTSAVTANVVFRF